MPMMNEIRIHPMILSFLLLIEMGSLWAQESMPLHLEKVLESTRDHAPNVRMALDRVLYYESKQRAASGAFDSSIDANYYDRDGEYYNSSYYKAKVTKPLPYLNSKIYGGHKKSRGNFPSYEGEVTTLEDGEFFGGVSLSLLRDRSIDKKRLKLRLSEYDVEIGKWKQNDLLMVMLQEATIAYWKWVGEGLKLKVAQNLLALAEQRQVAFQKRIKKGDLAAIYAAENEQYILKRKSKVAKLMAEVKYSALYLSLYYRDKDGRPIVAEANQLPELTTMKDAISYSLQRKNQQEESQELKGILDKNFSLQSLKVELNQIKKENTFYNTRFLPQLDLKYEYAEDRGAGPRSLYSKDHKIYLSLNIPLEYNTIKGNEQANMAALRIKEREVQFKVEQLNVKLEQLLTKLKALKEIKENTEKEVSLAVKLEDSERQKFTSGDSDYFVVNIREQNTADARVKLIESLFDFQEALAQYRAMVMDFKIL
jgi:outer membrane protein TolC